jgi:hypothetical protein
VIAGDQVSLGGATFAFADKNAGTNKTVNVTGLNLTGSDAGNYTVTLPSTVLASISPKTLTAFLTGVVSKTYDGTTGATLGSSNYGLSGMIVGDTVNLNDPNIGAYGDKNAGSSKTVNVADLLLKGADAGNYTLASTSISGAVGRIDPRAITVRADDLSKILGTADPAFTFSILTGSLVSGDNFSGALSRLRGETPGLYAILQGTLTLGGNYALSFTPGALTIKGPPPFTSPLPPPESVQLADLFIPVLQGDDAAKGSLLLNDLAAPYPDNQRVSDTIHFGAGGGR